ncbi:MAG: hypothetical protein R2867_39695 [Caldilineaceae bacterium]
MIAPDGLRAWVPSKQDNIARGTLRDGNNLTFENTVRSVTSLIDLTTNTEESRHGSTTTTVGLPPRPALTAPATISSWRWRAAEVVVIDAYACGGALPHQRRPRSPRVGALCRRQPPLRPELYGPHS